MTAMENNLELFLLLLVRITGFLYTAPFFSLRNVPMRVKAGLSIFLSLILVYSVDIEPIEYSSVVEYAIIAVKEALVGAILGLFANIAYHILTFAGQIIDMEIGFSMVSEFDPMTKIQTTITANLYGYLVLLVMMVTNLHHHFLKAIINSFEVVGIGNAVISPDIYQLMVHFITDYFIIGFRIVLPVFASILLVNTILAILAKVAPQMNMFVIGMQLKVLIGLFILVLIIELVPSVADFIFNEMMELLRSAVNYMV